MTAPIWWTPTNPNRPLTLDGEPRSPRKVCEPSHAAVAADTDPEVA